MAYNVISCIEVAEITQTLKIFYYVIWTLNPQNEEGLGLPQVVKKVLKKYPKKVILLKSTEESTQECTKKSAQVKKDLQKNTL